MGATCPGRWHSWQFFWRMRTTCLLKVMLPSAFGVVARAMMQPGASVLGWLTGLPASTSSRAWARSVRVGLTRL